MIPFRPAARLLPLLILFFALTSCQKVSDARMEDIAGEYRLTSVSDPRSSFLEGLPEAERNAIIPARISRAEDAGCWVFEYSLPTDAGQGHFSCRRILQEVIWEPSFGRYLFRRLTAEDLQGTELDPAVIRVEFKSGSIVATNTSTLLVCTWSRKQPAL
jgi:hypothetical protein